MMVEAGGTEKGLAVLRGRRPEGQRGRHRRRPRGLARSGSRSRSRSSVSWSRRLAYPRAARSTRRSSTTATTSSSGSSAVGASKLDPATRIVIKAERNEAIDKAGAEIAAELSRRVRRREKEIKEAIRSLTKKLVRRASSRTVSASTVAARRTSVRSPPQVGIVPTAHGSGLFQRGETQVLNVCTLGMPRMNQLLDTIGPDTQQALHAPLQHAAVGQRRDRSRRFAEAPRDRPRPARRARPAAGRAQPGGVLLHAPPRERGARVERLDLDGARCARRRCR